MMNNILPTSCSVHHPCVTGAYIQPKPNKDFDGRVLILETNLHVDQNGTGDGVDYERYMDLLVDLKDIQRDVEKRYGAVDRVDIKASVLH